MQRTTLADGRNLRSIAIDRRNVHSSEAMLRVTLNQILS
jgi:hypothetical protein